MIEIVKTFLLAGDIFIPEMHLRQDNLDSRVVLVDYLIKTKTEYKYSKKQVIHLSK